MPQDGYEVFMRVCRQEPTPQLLAAISGYELGKLLVGCTDYFDNENNTCDPLMMAINRTLALYPLEGTAS